MGLNPKGRDWGSLVNWDDLGKAYAGFIISWTVLLGAGMLWLVLNRHLPFIKIRNLPLAIVSTSFLHVYLVKIVLAYTTNGHFPCSAEFWIMSTYLPFGIALFQANVAQLRSISDRQQKFVSERALAPPHGSSPLRHARSLWARWSALPVIKRTYIFIGCGMVVQLVITGILYATTPTLQGDWSSYGKVSHAKGQGLCRRSYEWIPSAFWQLFWSWLYGPYILYQIRNIHDVHYWRLQIILSVVSGLPGAPLWLASVFTMPLTVFKPVNKWWVPPMWLAPGIVVMQFATVFFPIYEAYRSRAQMRTTMSILKSWEERRPGTDSEDHLISGAKSQASHGDSAISSSTANSRDREIRTMASLEKALVINPTPLLQFAATKDFTAENIVFLMEVRRWRSAWASAPRADNKVSKEIRSQLFNMAVEIYVNSINERTTEFPVNIEYTIRSALDGIFSQAVPEGKYCYESISDPFSIRMYNPKLVDRAFRVREHSSDSKDTVWSQGLNSPTTTLIASPATIDGTFEPHPCVKPLGNTRATIRSDFDEHVFDAAEKSIKYLVLTNTWQKFVRSSGDSFLQVHGYTV